MPLQSQSASRVAESPVVIVGIASSPGWKRSMLPVREARSRYGIPAVDGEGRQPLRVLQLRPPYEQLILPHPNLADVTRMEFGSVLALEVAGMGMDWSRIEQALASLRSRVPAAPVVLSLDSGMEDLVLVTTRAARLPVRALLLRGEPAERTLRRQMTQPASLADDVVEWLGLRGLRLPPATTYLVREIFARAPEHMEVGSLLEVIGVAESSARFRFQKKRLPPPSRWLHVARALHAALRVQAEPKRPLLGLAHELGYADHSALSNQMQRAFGMRPGAIRKILGWEWLMDRWLTVEREKAVGPQGRRDPGAKK